MVSACLCASFSAGLVNPPRRTVSIDRADTVMADNRCEDTMESWAPVRYTRASLLGGMSRLHIRVSVCVYVLACLTKGGCRQ